jgi:SAM-dependent methyltransferase
MGKVFVTKEIKIIEGEAASSLINEKNELQYFEDGVGIKKIDRERWDEAQYYERKTWCVSSVDATTDRNEEHLNNFNNYQLLYYILGDNLSVIELGCGAFTNLRYILPIIKKRVSSIHLLDPLINDYILNSPNCTYKNGVLMNCPVKIFNTPIEEFIVSQKYDLVVMINVLDHCYDIDVIFEKIFTMLNKSGVLVFNERAYKSEQIKESIETIYDAGHPIRLTEEYLNNKLSPYKSLYFKEFTTDNVIDKYLILQHE